MTSIHYINLNQMGGAENIAQPGDKKFKVKRSFGIPKRQPVINAYKTEYAKLYNRYTDLTD